MFAAEQFYSDRAVYYAWMFGYTSALRLAREGTDAQVADFELEVNDAVGELVCVCLDAAMNCFWFIDALQLATGCIAFPLFLKLSFH